MTCDQARDWLNVRLDGELPSERGALLDAHLARCPACAAAAAQTQRMLHGLSALREETRHVALRPPTPQRVNSSRHAGSRGAGGWSAQAGYGRLGGFAAAAAVALAIFAGLYSADRRREGAGDASPGSRGAQGLADSSASNAFVSGSRGPKAHGREVRATHVPPAHVSGADATHLEPAHADGASASLGAGAASVRLTLLDRSAAEYLLVPEKSAVPGVHIFRLYTVYSGNATPPDAAVAGPSVAVATGDDAAAWRW